MLSPLVLAVLSGVIPTFAVIALGYGLQKSNFIGRDIWPPIERLAIYVFYPCNLILATWSANLEGTRAGHLATSVILGLVAMIILVLLARPFLKLSGPTYSSVMQSAVRWNIFVFLPVINALFGAPGLSLAAVAVSTLIPLVNLCTITTLSVFGEGQAGLNPKTLIKSLLTNPIFASCLFGLGLNALGLPKPAYLFPAMKMVGDAALPLGLMVAGSGLSFSAAASQPRLVGGLCAVKLIVMPLLMYGAATLLGADPMVRTIALCAGAAPGAAASYVLARQMGGDAPLAAAVVAFTTLGSALTIPFLVALLGGS